MVKERNTDELYYSDWAYVYISTANNPDIPTVIDDHASTTAGIPVNINVLDNDINPSTSDPDRNLGMIMGLIEKLTVLGWYCFLKLGIILGFQWLNFMHTLVKPPLWFIGVSFKQLECIFIFSWTKPSFGVQTA